MSQGPGPGSAGVLPLLGTPDAFLEQLVTGQYLDHDSKVSLCKTCTKILHFWVQPLAYPILEEGIEPAIQAVQEAAERNHLSLTLWPGDSTFEGLGSSWWELKADAVEKLQLMTGVSCQFLQHVSQEALRYVTALEVQCGWFETILPIAIGKSCPTLTQLLFNGCAFKWDAMAMVDVTGCFQKLKSLELHDTSFWHTVNAHESAEADTAAMQGLEHVKEQLQGLNALQSMTVGLSDEHREALSHLDDHMQAEAYDLVRSVASQLTYLSLDTLYVICYDFAGCWDQLCPALLALKQLHLPDLRIADEEPEQLLQLPSLTHVQCDEFELEQSFAMRPCNWATLTCSSVSIKVLARLPLHAMFLGACC